MDADFFLVNSLSLPHTVQADELLYRHPCSAYTGFGLELSISGTWLRGNQIVRDGKLCTKPQGRFIPGGCFKQ